MNREEKMLRATEKFLDAQTSMIFSGEIPARLLLFWCGKRNNRRDRIFKLALEHYHKTKGRQLVFEKSQTTFLDRMYSGKYQWNGLSYNKYERLIDPRNPNVVYCSPKEYDEIYYLFFLFVRQTLWSRLFFWRQRNYMTLFEFDDYPSLFFYKQTLLHL